MPQPFDGALPSAAGPLRLAGRRVLVVEDESMVAMLIEDVIRDAGAEVIVAPTGKAALEAAERHRIDLAIVDLALPDMPGHQVMAGLRASSPRLPILIETGLSAVHAAALADGAATVLEKPFDPAELIAAIVGLLQVVAPGRALEA